MQNFLVSHNNKRILDKKTWKKHFHSKLNCTLINFFIMIKFTSKYVLLIGSFLKLPTDKILADYIDLDKLLTWIYTIEAYNRVHI